MIAIGNADALSILKDPFQAENLRGVEASWRRIILNDGKELIIIEGNVRFQNGATEGRQTFKAESFDNLLFQIKTFVETLPKTQTP